MNISEEEIRETFYNLMLEVALSRDLKNQLRDPHTRATTVRLMIADTVKVICDMSSASGFPTLRGHHVTTENVCENFKDMFRHLAQIRQIVDPQRQTQSITYLVQAIIQKETFKQIIQDLIKFYLESVEEKKKPVVSVESIRETFYNLMVEEVLTSPDQPIKREHLIDQDAFIFFALSSIVILSSLKSSKNHQGIWLCNGAIVTEANCPPSYRPLFQHLLKIKDKYKALNLTDNQLRLVKMCSINDPEVELPEHLVALQTPELMSLVSAITDLAINISAIGHFKDVLNDVIKYCIEALG